jgi:hypothetical protein
MTNKNITDLHLADICDEDEHEHCDDEVIINTLLEHVLTGSNQLMQTAVELTKMIIQQNSGKSAKDILKVYQDSLKVVMESSPIPNLLNLMGAELN